MPAPAVPVSPQPLGTPQRDCAAPHPGKFTLDRNGVPPASGAGESAIPIVGLSDTVFPSILQEENSITE